MFCAGQHHIAPTAPCTRPPRRSRTSGAPLPALPKHQHHIPPPAPQHQHSIRDTYTPSQNYTDTYTRIATNHLSVICAGERRSRSRAGLWARSVDECNDNHNPKPHPNPNLNPTHNPKPNPNHNHDPKPNPNPNLNPNHDHKHDHTLTITPEP